MHLIVIAALAAVCGAAKLDRTYLPPPSAQTAGGSPGALQTPFGGASFRSQGNQGLGGIPKGAYSNDFGGVVVDAAASGTRAAGPEETGLGAPRPSYGSQVSKVGDAAFRGAPVAGFRQTPAPQGDEDTVNAATNGNPSERFGNGNDKQGSRFQASSSAAVRSQPSRFDNPSFNAEPVEAERPKAEQERQAGILRYNSEVGADTYSYSFETDNGISAEENGVAINGVQAQGAFSYTGDDGQTYSVTYTADENGYQPRGDHLPTPPPIPDAILKSLELNAKEEAAGLSDDGSYDARKYNAASDYNESDNNNGRYNGAESNKGSGNGVIASAEVVSGLAKQNGAFKQTQNFENDQQGNDFNSQAPSQSGQIGDRFGNNDNFLQSASAAAQNGLRQDSGNKAYAVASQSSGNVAGGFGQLFQGSFAQQKPDQRFRGQSVNNGNKFYQQSQDRGSVFGANDNDLGQQTKEQASVFGDKSSSTNVNKFAQQTEAHSSKFGAPPSDIKFGQQTQSQISQFAATSQSNSFGQKTQAQTSGALSSQGQASGFNVQSTGSANNFGQHTQAQGSGFGGQKFGYLPPKQNGGRTPQGPKVPETTAFNSQSQSSFQQSNNIASQIHPTKQPDTTLTTPFETPRIDFASQLASSENGEAVQMEQKPSFAGQFSEASAEVKLPQSSFTRRPSNQGNGFDRFPQKSGVRPQAQNFRQQNIPVANSSGKPQGSASAFASFNSQETVASAENFNSDDEEQTTGVAYTDTTPTTESPAQFGQFEQAQNQYNQASQGQFNQGFQPQNRPQFSGSTQKPFRHNNFVQQQTSNNGQDNSYYYKQPSTSFNVPETSNNNFQSPSSGQFDRVTEQPNFDAQSSAQFASSQTGQFGSHTNFQGQQSSTKYPRPPTLLAVDPTLTVNTETDIPQTTYQAQYNNGVTQASASSFASNNPSSQFNGGSSQKFPQRQQFSQFNTQATQSFSRPQSSSFGQQTTAIPSSFSQQNQYDQSGNGINQFSGAQTFRQRVTNNQQFGKQEPKKEPTTEVPASTYEGEIYQYNKPAEVLPAPSQDPTPQGSEETPVQFDSKQPDQRVQSQNQFQRNQFSQDFGQQVDERVPLQQESSEFVGGSAAFKVDGDTASSVAGKGEVFGGPRQPPSFDEETGYHY